MSFKMFFESKFFTKNIYENNKYLIEINFQTNKVAT